MEVPETFSKVVRSLLLDVDLYFDQLVQIGYFSGEQRAFLDKFTYKSEDALGAAKLVSHSKVADGTQVLPTKAALKAPLEDITAIKTASENIIASNTPLEDITDVKIPLENNVTSNTLLEKGATFRTIVEKNRVLKTFSENSNPSKTLKEDESNLKSSKKDNTASAVNLTLKPDVLAKKPAVAMIATARQGVKKIATVDEQEVVDKFLRLCKGRNFSVHLNSPELTKEPNTKIRTADYVSSLESIAESTANSSGEIDVIVSQKVVKGPDQDVHGKTVLIPATVTAAHVAKIEGADIDNAEVETAKISSKNVDRTLTHVAKNDGCESDDASVEAWQTVEELKAKYLKEDESAPSVAKADGYDSDTAKSEAAKSDDWVTEAAKTVLQKFDASKYSKKSKSPVLKHTKGDGLKTTKGDMLNTKGEALDDAKGDAFNNTKDDDSMKIVNVDGLKTAATNKVAKSAAISCTNTAHEIEEKTASIKTITPPASPFSSSKPNDGCLTNSWGKPIKSSAYNKEGDVVGGKAKPLGPENRGRAMMEKMGWSLGAGLGKKKDGILEPIAHVVKTKKNGLGSSVENIPHVDAIWNVVEKEIPAEELNWDKPNETEVLAMSIASLNDLSTVGPNTIAPSTVTNATAAPGTVVSISATQIIAATEVPAMVIPVVNIPVTATPSASAVPNNATSRQPCASSVISRGVSGSTTSPKNVSTRGGPRINASATRKRLQEASVEGQRNMENVAGIRAYWLRESDNKLDRTLQFSSKIRTTNEYKSTKHYPGVIVRALCSQKRGPSSHKDVLDVGAGNVLEVLRVHNGPEYVVYNFSKRMRGIVRIASLEMENEPNYSDNKGSGPARSCSPTSITSA